MMQNIEETVQPSELPTGSMLLQGQYEIQQQLAVGGFGITYLARDSLSRQVVVKECFPDGLCVREGLLVLPDTDSKQVVYQKIVWNFVAEARRLARLKHPNIVAVHQVFEENHTAYMAMDFVDGEELLDILETRPERLTPRLLEKSLRAALDAIQHLHDAGFLHRDISPDNLLLDTNDHLTLIDFGAARENSQYSATASTFLLAVKDGYSPHEFYAEDTPQDMSSDLYSLGATFYHLITGAAPIDCWTRLQTLEAGEPDPFTPLRDGDWAFAENFLALIDQAMAVAKEDRIQTAAEWLARMSEEAAEAPKVVKNTAPTVQKPAEKPRVIRTAQIDFDAISQIVEEINTGLAEIARDAPFAEDPPPAAQPEACDDDEEARQLVDILGNPIEDLDKWLREQDREEPVRKKPKTQAVPVPDEEPEPQRKPLILRLLSGPLNLTRNTASTVKT